MQDITLYMWATPNSRRASILLEELGLTFEVQPVNLRAGEQHDPKIVALNPFARLPSEDIDHYRKMVVAINESIRIMDEIDEIIDDMEVGPKRFMVKPVATLRTWNSVNGTC